MSAILNNEKPSVTVNNASPSPRVGGKNMQVALQMVPETLENFSTSKGDCNSARYSQYNCASKKAETYLCSK
jgi:hypothetical protein